MLSPNVRVMQDVEDRPLGDLVQRAHRRATPSSGGRSWTRTSSSRTAAQVGVDPEADVARGYTVSDGGITVVGKGVTVKR